MNLLLRKLTLKSKIGFGHFKDYTVADLFAISKEYELIQIYYNLEKIDYTDDILDLLGITKIEKPGKCPEMLKGERRAYWDRKNASMTKQELFKHFAHIRKTKRINVQKTQFTNSYSEQNKRELQAMNHGKY